MNGKIVDECPRDIIEIKQEPVENENIADVTILVAAGNRNEEEVKQELMEIGDCKISCNEKTLDYKLNFVEIKSGECDIEHDSSSFIKESTKNEEAVQNKKIYNCLSCMYTSNSKHYYTLHLKKHDSFLVDSHSGQKLFKCNWCEYESKYKANIRRHIKLIHEKDKHKNVVMYNDSVLEVYECDKQEEKRKEVRFEMDLLIKQGYSCKFNTLMHSNEKIFSCTYCNYKANKKRYLMRHLKGDHGERRCKKYRCSECPYITHNSQYFDKHLSKHLLGSDKILQCSQCEYRTNYLCTLKIHVENKHSDVKSFKCSKCDYQSSFKANIKKHLRKHNNIRPYKCDVCGTSFKDKFHLDRHGLVHSEERNFHCAHCNYKSKRKGHLTIHLKDKHIRQQNKEYKCSECSYQTNRSTRLKKHVHVHYNVAK